MKKIGLILISFLALLTVNAQDVRFSMVVSGAGSTRTVSIYAQSIGSANNMMGFTTYLYYDNTKATVTGFNATPVTGPPNNWGTANESSILFQSESNPSVPSTHTGYFFYQNFDNNFAGFAVPSAQTLLMSVSFTIISGNGGDVYLASTAQVPPLVYLDNGFTGHPVIVVGQAQQALPVELASFEARASDMSIQLKWASAHEQNFSGYELQRSENGIDFTKIAWAQGKGGGDYAYTDGAVRPGPSYYYRLRMVDLNGRSEHSPIRSAKLNGPATASLTITPNPATQYFVADFEASGAGDTTLELVTPSGQVAVQQHFQLNKGPNKIMVSTGNQPEGTYLVRLKTVDGTMTGKVVVAR
ncbi:MAG: T9SS type A sorting domain-containing protein [Saprospiraceae bacterium]|nr:T9SS type A sorting domain-containing protein [Saprospiraceae bacterium]